MREFLQTPNGKVMVVGLIVPCVIALASWLYPLGQPKRALDVSVTQNVELIASPVLSKNGVLRFIYNDQQVSNLISTKVRLKNSGSVPIQKDDFIGSLDISFPSDTRIVSYSLTQVQPLKDVSLVQKEMLEQRGTDHLIFKPKLINPNDIYDIDILATRDGFGEGRSLSYSPDEISFDYTIYGISSINRVPKIETSAERHAASRQTVNGWIMGIPNVLQVFAILLTVVLILYLIESRERSDKSKESTKLRIGASDVFALVVIAFGLIGILYAFGKIIYEAYFL